MSNCLRKWEVKPCGGGGGGGGGGWYKRRTIGTIGWVRLTTQWLHHLCAFAWLGPNLGDPDPNHHQTLLPCIVDCQGRARH